MANAEKYLERIGVLDTQINDRWEDLQRLYAMRTKMTTVFSMAPVAGSGNKSKIEDLTIKIEPIEIELNRKIDEFIDYKAEATRLIERLNNTKQSSLLRKVYFNYMEIEDIAYEMGLSTKTIQNRLDEALQSVDALLDDGKESGVENADCTTS